MIRFKTKNEFIREFGEAWRYKMSLAWMSDMDIFFGMEIPDNILHGIKINDRSFAATVNGYAEWRFGMDMTTDQPIGAITKKMLEAKRYGYHIVWV